VTTVSSVSVRGGDAGTLDDLSVMVGLVNQSLVNPLVVSTARTLAVNSAPARDQYRQAIGIRSWLARYFRFVDDPAGLELLRDPENLLREYFATGRMIGDCDEAAVLGAALGKAIGIPAYFTVLAFAESDGGSGMFSHVFASLLTDDGRSVSLDVTKPPGSVPAPTRVWSVEV
jgi:transglutaminase-like putative cysteine protease